MGNLASFLSEINYFRMRSYGQFRLLISRQFFGQDATPFRMAADRCHTVDATCRTHRGRHRDNERGNRLMVEINRIANTPYPLAEREQLIAELQCEIDRLQQAIVVATGAPRERGCPP